LRCNYLKIQINMSKRSCGASPSGILGIE